MSFSDTLPPPCFAPEREAPRPRNERIARIERPGDAAGGLASSAWSVTWVRRKGRATSTIRIPRGGVWLLGLIVPALCGTCVYAGWSLRETTQPRFALEYRMAQHRGATQAEWSRGAPKNWMHAFASSIMRPHQARRLADRLGLGSTQAAGRLLGGSVDPRWLEAVGGGERAPGSLLWPVEQGWFVRGYGSGEDGYHLAVDIMGRTGWDVRAAASGIVAYSGNEIRGYGNLVLLVHRGGWVTVYAHNSKNKVYAGQRVQRGDVIALVGNTGISRGPHVHFEFLHQGKNCDPASLFRPGIQHRSGSHAPVKPSRWVRAESRPDAVRCSRRRYHPNSRRFQHMHADEDLAGDDASALHAVAAPGMEPGDESPN